MADTVTVTWGEEYFQPEKYNGYKVGPFTIQRELKPGQSIVEATEEIHKELEEVAQLVFMTKRNAFAGRYRNRE